MRLVLWILVAVLATAPARGNAQQPVVKVNLAAEMFLDPLPYWQDFVIQGSIPPSVERVVITASGPPIGSAGRPPVYIWDKFQSGFDAEKQFSIPVDGIEPNQTYTYCFAVFGVLEPPDTSRIIEPCVTQLRSTIERFGTPATVRVVRGSARSTWQQHFDADLGIMASRNAQYLGVVTGVHIHMVPVREDVPLNATTVRGFHRFARRVSVYAGISPVEIHSETDQPIEKTRIGVPVVGVSVRGPLSWLRTEGVAGQVLDIMRVSGGVMFFQQEDANPIASQKVAKRDLFIGLSGDLDIAKVISPLTKVLGL